MSSACGHRAHPRRNREAATLPPRPHIVRSSSLTASTASVWPRPVAPSVFSAHVDVDVDFNAATELSPNAASAPNGPIPLEHSP
jgi:hypothetical protein